MNWISVKDKMPEEEQRILVVDQHGYYWVALCQEHLGNKYFSFAVNPDKHGTAGECCRCNDPKLNLTTHWMPLPQPPLPEEIKFR